MPIHPDVETSRAVLLALARDIPARCRLVEKSPGAAAGRKFAKLRAFGGRYLKWGLNRLGLLRSGEVTFPLFFGKELTLPFKLEDDFVTLYLAGALGGPEYKLTRFFIRHLKAGDVFYDVGASYGFYTHLACALLVPERVHAFEPLPEIFSWLSKNAAPGSRLNNFALWDKTGTAEMGLHYLGHGFSTLSSEMVAIDPPRASRKVEVKTATLDEYALDHAPPTMMKVDVEGAEEKLIEGGKECLSNYSPVVSLEVIAGEAGTRLSLKALSRMLELGYQAFALTEDGELEGPYSADEWRGRLDEMASGNTADQISWDNAILQRPGWPISPRRSRP